MLFNSVEFIFYFLPCALFAFYAVAPQYRLTVLLIASLVFYSYWNPAFTPLLLGSVLVNFLFYGKIATALNKDRSREARTWAALGIALNLTVLGYFKYRLFIADLVAWDSSVTASKLVIPLAISFFTFQQISFLVDATRGEVGHVTLFRYATFVSFFPHLIAGPIVRHNELIPQFDKTNAGRAVHDIIIGACIFSLGLFKKVVIADGIAVYGNPVFSLAQSGQAMSAFDAWTAIAAYHYQLYFDFSGYSTMAIGLGKMFGYYLPINFMSPYKAASIIDFWRRWHMSLSRFLRDYLYIPLGGNRHGSVRRYANLLLTMFLGGLWHGAAWGFVLWGVLHGLYLVINHLWSSASRRLPLTLGVLVTTLAVLLAWVPFRLETLTATWHFYQAMLGLQVAPCVYSLCGGANNPAEVLPLLAIATAIVLLLPTVEQIFRYDPDGNDRSPALLDWLPQPRWIAVVSVAFFVSVVGIIAVGKNSDFLYFQF